MMLRSRRLLRFVFPLPFVLLATACTDGTVPQPLSGVEVIEIPEADTTTRVNLNIDNPTLDIPETIQVDDGDLLTLVWSDEFNDAQLDPEVWFFETGDGSQYGIPGWGNNEWQYYLPDNARLEGGKLIIEAKLETVTLADDRFGYTSARINTRDRFAFKYGRIEASIKMPSGQGFWPAFWMLSQDSDYLCDGEPCVWAAIGEIDIVEAVNLGGTGGNEIFGTIHYGGEFPNNLSSSTNYTPSVDITEGFNTYALEWDETEIRWYFNGLLYAMENFWDSDADGKDFPAPFDQDFYVLFNLAVGGNFPGSPNGTTPFPSTMEVDWVRVYSGEEPPPPPSAGDHGPGTAGVYTETTTESPITVTSITNSIDFGGNNTVADPNSMAIPAFDGDVVLAIEYQDTGSTYGGAVLNFGAVDLTAYDTLNFTVDTSGMAGFGDLTIQIEPPGAGAAGTNVLLSNYVPVSTSGNWATYAIPLADYTVTDFAAAANLGFWNPKDGADALTFGTLYVDDVYFSTEGGGAADHGPGTASVFTETATESEITVTSITNSIDFGGNNTVADANSMAIPAFEGDVVLSIEYQDSGSTYGGAVLNFGGVDLTAYDTLNFTLDTTGMANFADLTIQIEPPGAGAAGTNVLLSNYVPVSTSGNWATYAIPLADYTVTDFAAAANLGFWNPKDGADALTFGTLYVDDVYFSTEGGGGGGAGEIAVNGGFETGDFTGWTQFEATPGDQTVNMGMAGDTSSEGTFHLEINNTVALANSLIKQERVGLGTVTPGIAWTVTFDARGSFGEGGVAFAQVFSETAAGNENCDGCGILGGAPLALNADPTVWTSFSFSGTAGPTTESLTLQLEAVTGPGALANVFYDNISIVVGDGGG